MTLSLHCSQCGAPMTLEADESAGQEIIDKLALCVRCFRCVKVPKPPTRPAQPLPYRKPYAD